MAELKIKKEIELSKIKEWFSTSFPNLKIEVFKEKHKDFKGNEAASLIKEDNIVVSLKDQTTESSFSLFEDYSTALVEHMFLAKLNINAQVYRKSGRVWLQTTTTDNWTLKEQMDRAH